MKKAIFILLVSISTIVYGQKEMYEINSADSILGMPAKNGKVNYSGIVVVDSISKENLYVKTKSYVIDIFKSGKDVIQFDDKEAGILTSKGFFKVYWTYLGTVFTYNVWFVLKTQFKDGKTKYELTDLVLKYTQGTVYGEMIEPIENYKKDKYPNSSKKLLKSILPDIDRECKSIVKGLEKALKEKSDSSDW